MIKKLFVILNVIIVLIYHNVYAEDTESYIKELNSYGISPIIAELKEDDLVSRYNAVILTCESVGFSSKTYKKMCDIAFYSKFFSDIGSSMDSIYFNFAAMKNIANGTETTDPKGIPNFEPSRNTTYEEAVAFITRCIAPPKGINSVSEMDLSETWEYAKQERLLDENEFDEKKQNDINYGDFCKLLYRLIQKTAYIDAYNEIEINSEKIYLDVLQEVGADEIAFFKEALKELEH